MSQYKIYLNASKNKHIEIYARIYVLKKNLFYELTLFNRRKTVNKVC